MVRVPVMGPVVVGVKMMLTKQAAFGARVPVQVGPPVGFAVGSARMKLPVRAGVERETGGGGEVGEGEEGWGRGAVDGDRAEVLRGGREDEAGERKAGAGESEGRGSAGGGGGQGEGCVLGDRLVEGVNWTPSQQLVQEPV